MRRRLRSLTSFSISKILDATRNKRSVALFGALFIGFFSAMAGLAAQEPSLTVDLENFTSYFTTQSILRHNRYEIHVKEIVPLSPSLTTVLDLRGRAEAALSDINTKILPHYSNAVRDDELIEGEIRQLYLDWLGNSVRIKMGLLQIDWIDSLSPLTSDVMTPLDLRFGGFGTNKEIIVPEPALDLNHKLFGGTLEWLVVALPVTHRLPAGNNGYGFYPYLQNQVTPLAPELVTGQIPRTLSEVEGGIRYQLEFDPLELSFLAYRGHQRTPTLVVGPLGPSSIPITEVYGRATTLGVSGTYGTDAAIFRLFTYAEPHRYPAVVSVVPGLDPAGQLPFETRIRVGGGFDYVFSKHLKLYSEVTGTHTEYPSGQMNYLTTVRVTNESFKNILLSLNTTVGFPKSSYLITPEMTWTFDSNTKLGLGAHFIHSGDPGSAFEIIKDASQVYGFFQYSFALW